MLVQELREEQGRLAQALDAAHGRGQELLPAQRYRTDSQGMVRAVFRTGGPAWLFWNGTSKLAELKPGEQDLEWNRNGV